MNDTDSGGSKILVLVGMIVIVLFFSFVFYGSKIPFLSMYHEKIFGKNNLKPITSSTAELEQKEIDWCKPENIFVDSSVEEPITRKVIGFDDNYKCCVRETFGFNCALQKNTVVSICYTSTVGGKIVYVKVDGVDVDIDSYNFFLEDLDKKHIDNKVCNIDKYPQVLV
jgi:hypothetical protein